MFPVTSQCDSLPVGLAVVKQDQYAAALEADQILAQARADAEKLRREAKEEYQRQKQQGYTDGMEQAAVESAKRMVSNVAETVSYFNTVEERMVEVVGKSLRKILGEIGEQELIVKVARHALGWARSQSRVTLRVAPAQMELLRDRVDEMLKNYPVIEVLDIDADEHMRPGDCILETEIGSVNASIDMQLEAIETALRKSIKGVEEESQPETVSNTGSEESSEGDNETASLTSARTSETTSEA